MKGKLKRFAVVAQRDNVLEPGKEIFKEIKGRWNERYFPSRQPITVELACGRGEYTVNLARQFP
ncbi:MAG TPA: tRNA (guanosine(46)-N7)-methyltransferase TrmB, partial [Cytophagales bacterium]|nr:tRNA (guanosine(46)-N7)-methyltransferase TrmB [Cytophagales bacterium]